MGGTGVISAPDDNEKGQSTHPTICSGLKCSHPSRSETAQISNVRHESIVDLAVADTLRVTARPQKLNSAMLQAMTIELVQTVRLLTMSFAPWTASK